LMLGLKSMAHEFLEVHEKDGVKENRWTNWDYCFEI
jgi:hypothetical protein